MKTRNFLVFSLLGNVALVGVVGVLISRWPSVGAVDAAPPTGPNSSTSFAIQPFRWSQLESSDYPTYVANLRAIGCPEQTIADIIAADVDSLYAPRRRHLDQEKAPLTGQNLEAERQRLWQEETNLIARILGWQQASPVFIASTTQTNDQRVVDNTGATPERKFSMPLVFAPVDTNALNLNPRQQALVEGLRRQFLNELGGTSADPNSPDYADRWKQAQPEIDQRLKAMLGYQTYRKFARQSSQPGPTRPGE